MRKLFIVMLMTFISVDSFAAAPAIQCPAGYIQLREPTAILGYPYCESIGSIVPVEVERPASCLVDSPEPVCTMFIPQGMKYQDETGEYQYSGPCALDI